MCSDGSIRRRRSANTRIALERWCSSMVRNLSLTFRWMCRILVAIFLHFRGTRCAGLWARRELLDAMPPFQAGSNMAHDVEIESVPSHFAEGGRKFEAGTPNVHGAVGLAAAVNFLNSLDRKTLWAREQQLTQYILSAFKKIKGLRILGPAEPNERISVFSFVVENRQPL